MAGRRSTPLAPALVAGAAMSGLAVLFGPDATAVVGGILLAVVLPGLAATRGFFPGRVLVPGERVVLAPVLSLVTVALGGLGMYAAGVPLTRTSWVILTVALTLILAAIGELRRRRLTKGNWAMDETRHLGAIPAAEHARAMPVRHAALRLTPLLLAVVLAVGAGYLSVRSEARAQAGQSDYTELSVVPAAPRKSDNVTWPVVIGVISHERSTTRYEVRVAGAHRFAATFTPTVGSGATWAKTLEVPADGTVTVMLLRAGDTKPYRTVWISGKIR